MKGNQCWKLAATLLGLSTIACFAGKTTIIGKKTGNGDFDADKSKAEASMHNATDHWFNLSGSEAGPHATKLEDTEQAGGDDSRYALMLKGPVFINDTGHKVAAAGEVFMVEFDFWDMHPRWFDDNDAIEIFFFTTDGKVDGYTAAKDIKEVATVSFSKIEEDGKFEEYSNDKAYTTTGDDVGKQFFVGIRAKTDAGFGALDNFVFKVSTK